jgi:predicted double-glycine peptidase
LGVLLTILALLRVGAADAQSGNGGADPESTDVESVSTYVRLGVGTPGLHGGQLGGFAFPTDLRPLSAHRWDRLVRQELDAGCGPASLATIYTHYLDLPVTEEEMSRSLTAQALRRGRSRADVGRRGYSLADIKRAAERGRLITAAFKADLEGLPNLKIPVITHINIRGYGHFVVLRGVVGNRVVVADPNFGNMTYPLGQFGNIWSGLLLAIGRPKGGIPQLDFDAAAAPTIQEIDYELFQRKAELPALPLAGLSLNERIYGVDLGALFPKSAMIPVVTLDRMVTEFNSD